MIRNTSPINKLKGGLVQIFNENDFVGFGFLISDTQLITCAHVLNDAKKPGLNGYKITFPMSDDPQICNAGVIDNGLFSDFFVDLAVLEIHDALCFHLHPAPIIYIQPEALWHHTFIACGFPKDSPVMDYIDGNIIGPNEKQWIQLEDKDKAGRFIEKGFSGTPIWDEVLQAIVGMVVSIDENIPSIAFMTPITTIVKTYPKIIGCIFNNIKSNWPISLENHYGFREGYVESPLKSIWEIFSRSQSWREKMLGRMKTVHSTLLYIKDLQEVESLVTKTQAIIESDSTYEKILEEISSLSTLLDSSRITNIINQKIEYLEKSIGVRYSELRNSNLRKMNTEEKLLLSLSSLLQFQVDIRAICQLPNFDKCLLIMGGMGSGKTHFIYEILNESLNSDDLLVLPIIRQSKTDSVLDIILGNLNHASNIQWPSLEYFGNFLKVYDSYMDQVQQEQSTHQMRGFDINEEDINFLKNIEEDSYDDKFESYYEEEPFFDIHPRRVTRFERKSHDTRWIISIDDLSNWVSDNKLLITEWIELVIKSTNLQSLYWIVTITNSYYVHLAQYSIHNKSFWTRYGTLDYQDKISTYIRGYKQSLPNIAKWLVLDAFNEQHEVGLNVLSKYLIEKWEQFQLAIQHNLTAKKNLSNPLIAWIWLDLINQKEHSNLVTAVNLNYIEFIHYFWTQQFSFLFSHPMNQHHELQFSEQDLRYFVILLARFIIHKQNQVVDIDELKTSISVLSKGKMGFNDKKRIEAALDLLKLGFILDEKNEEGSLNEPKRILELRFYPFWGYFLAQEILKEGEKIPTSPIFIEKWFNNIHEKIISDTLEYFLLIATNQYSGKSSLPFFEHTLSSTKLPSSSVWMASAKSNDEIKKNMSIRAQRAVGRVFDPQALFAYIYYLSEIPTNIMSVRDRFVIFHKLFSQIGRNGFSSYFFYITERLFEKLESPKELVSVMPCLSNCEVMGISRELAELTANTLFKLVKNQAVDKYGYIDKYDPRKILNSLVDYLIIVKDEYYHKDDWKSFREGVLYFVLTNLAFDYGTMLYQFLTEVRWYDNSLFKFNWQIQLHMEREANLALGMLNRTTHYKDLMTLLKKLYESDEPLDHLNAVHIIRHTEVIGERNQDVHVSSKFLPLLENLFLYKDRSMTDLINHPTYIKFFRDNLKNFDKLNDERKN